MESKGGINQYICDKCGHTITTINADVGVTPFMVACKNPNHCVGVMFSQEYGVSKNLTPDHEWYKPESTKYLSKQEREHVSKGGLVLGKLDLLRAGEVK
jgi:hypothetical protein